jgi:hypothetical protein
MFARFRQTKGALQVSLVETRRRNGRVEHKHLGSARHEHWGRDRHVFWAEIG